jgi:hypothetical protein
MAYAWFVCQYKIRTGFPNRRYCAMNDHNALINANGGAWAETEVLGGYALVKVRANAATLTIISGTANFWQVTGRWLLSDTLGTLTTTQRNAILTRLADMGYSTAEIEAIMGTSLAQWRTRTLANLLNFVAQRRLTPRFDEVLQQIILDGAMVPCKAPAAVDAEVP